ncbi:MAG: CoB--CoM heterodisulfide reductase iron-sulfur subunit B family protein [Anaerolineae bacterium]|jgi:heterodisulfide reductase subunit B
MKYAYFPGCSQESTAQEYNRSLLAVAQRLDAMELIEIPDWSCCGATPAAAIVHPTLPDGLAARNLAITNEMGLDSVVAPCASCYKNLRKASLDLRKDEALRVKLENSLDNRKLEHVPEVRHPLDVVVNDVGVDNIPVEQPLSGMKIACYYGCLLTRPAGGFDDIEYPTSMDRLLTTLGAETVDWAYKTKCCGGGIYMFHENVSFAMSADVLAHAKAAGANAVAAACPFCQLLLDLYQDKLADIRNTTFDLPILFFTQLMGLAMGLDRAELGLERLIVSPFGLLAETVDAPEDSKKKPKRARAARPTKWGEA